MRLASSLCIILSMVFCGILRENGGGTNQEEGKNEGELRARRLAKFKMYGNYICLTYECMYYLQMDGYSV